MNVMEDIAEPMELNATALFLPCGLLGLEHIKRFRLVSNPEEEPFSWLEVDGETDLAFIVAPPCYVAPDYAPKLTDDDVEFLDLESPSDALIYNIVTLRGRNAATVNLKGPIVVNRHTMRGKQVILANASEYSVQHPLPTLG
ncbi:MAG TPA: flagellar assembly protein FliW [Methylomirabilota bacterium]|nr:flagellar assembly protein FliW [Methylomirabilota bacterium]